MRRKKIIQLDGLGNEIKISKKRKRKERKKGHGKDARSEKRLLRERHNKKEIRIIKAVIADQLRRRSNGYHSFETRKTIHGPNKTDNGVIARN